LQSTDLSWPHLFCHLEVRKATENYLGLEPRSANAASIKKVFDIVWLCLYMVGLHSMEISQFHVQCWRLITVSLFLPGQCDVWHVDAMSTMMPAPWPCDAKDLALKVH
jgi:hypothetical protein